MNTFGQFFKSRRAALGLSLRRFCETHGLDASNISKLERGLLPPPQGDKMREYAKYLGLKEGSDKWFELFDLAAAATGRLPADLQDADLAAKLPVLFRTLRESAKDGGKDTDALLRDLLGKIKKA